MTALARRLVARVDNRLHVAGQEGFTLIELINVLLILAILMSISVSAYSTLKARANEKSALANISVVVPAINAWRADNGNWTFMTMPLLNADYLNNGLDITYYDVGSAMTDTHFCVQYTSPSGSVVAKTDETGKITVGPASAPSSRCS
jgi:prepilin-type N-terminal cleavage/methylation domain-containing protein